LKPTAEERFEEHLDPGLQPGERLAMALAIPCLLEWVACAAIFFWPALGWSRRWAPLLIGLFIAAGFAAPIGVIAVIVVTKTRTLWACLAIYLLTMLVLFFEILMGVGAVGNAFL
jgi:hypothetical protein